MQEQHQQTIRSPIQVIGREPYGGNEVQVTLKPAEPNTGIIFQTPRGDVKASPDYVTATRRSLLLQDRDVQVINIEHFLATLFAYRIDNALIEVERHPSRSFKALEYFGLSNKAQVLPHLRNRQRELCDKIEEAGVKEQPEMRRLIQISEPTGNKQLRFEPQEEGITFKAVTNYSTPGEQEVELDITPFNYKTELAQSRPYIAHITYWTPEWLANFVAQFFNPTFGIGHGFTKEAYFCPVRTKKQWHSQEIYPAEIARHTIVDRLGAIALLPGRLEGARITARFSDHANDIKTLNLLVNQLSSPAYTETSASQSPQPAQPSLF